MSRNLTIEQRTLYTYIIDKILCKSDLNTISAKAIRKELSTEVGQDVSEQKEAVGALIMERFDSLSKTTPPPSDDAAARKAKPQPNGTARQVVKREVKSESSEASPGASTPQTTGDDSEVDIAPPPRKRKREQDGDAKLAAKLQAEENSRARPSRGGVHKKPAVVRKKSTPRKKSAAKIKKDDDSDIELGSDGEPKVVVRKGGFHKQYNLSEPLAALVGEPQLSRPQVVKKIWVHIKALNLQDPSDKRQIMCDDKMYAVFKQDKVQMFTMNKLLGKQLYPVEGAEE